ncbi:DUF4166 domain-containing protein [Ahniella affigens]|uniref:DUF4166 domain-containing protein n=1 Tax=Ahniella affigens TaxID=2021234 RepID=A0A2P1PSP7_9GAMM|nr:DUF4166 domain-containing protein [Ahniella affigens]AVP97853.1 DUF4166 domain-containing protein [Ahniella affigens]
MSADIPTLATPRLFQSLLGAGFAQLPAANQAMHQIAGRSEAHGHARIERGRNLLARLVGAMARMPTAADRAPLCVRFDTVNPYTEQWTRRFGTQAFSSRLAMEHGALVERLFPLTLRFRLQVADGVLHWQLLDARVLGLIPMPRWFAPSVEAREWSDAGRYHFLAGVSLPGVGLIVRYQGSLDAPKPCPF